MANVMLSYWYRLYTKQTKQERLVEKKLCKLGVRYRTQHIVLAAKAILDFYLPDYNLCIEIDDASHLRKQKKDQERTKRLTGLGIKVIRFTNDEVDNNVNSVITKIQDWLDNNG
jgi:very-short-patch-repair endonuclease